MPIYCLRYAVACLLRAAPFPLLAAVQRALRARRVVCALMMTYYHAVFAILLDCRYCLRARTRAMLPRARRAAACWFACRCCAHERADDDSACVIYAQMLPRLCAAMARAMHSAAARCAHVDAAMRC